MSVCVQQNSNIPMSRLSYLDIEGHVGLCNTALELRWCDRMTMTSVLNSSHSKVLSPTKSTCRQLLTRGGDSIWDLSLVSWVPECQGVCGDGKRASWRWKHWGLFYQSHFLHTLGNLCHALWQQLFHVAPQSGNIVEKGLLLFSCSVMSDSLQPHGLQHAMLPWPSLSLGVCSNSCPIELMMPSNQLILCCPLLLPSVFPNIRIFSNKLALCIRWPKFGALASVLMTNIQGWFPLGLTDLISLLSKDKGYVLKSRTKQQTMAPRDQAHGWLWLPEAGGCPLLRGPMLPAPLSHSHREAMPRALFF